MSDSMNLSLKTLKGRYREGEPVGFALALPDGFRTSGEAKRVRVAVFRGLDAIFEGDVVLDGGPGRETGFALELPAGAATPGEGFRVTVSAEDGHGFIRSAWTAFDYGGEGASRSVRYGFLSEFDSGGASGEYPPGDDSGAVRFLAECHSTHAQFYDWSRRPEGFGGESTTYRDLMGKEIDLDTVRRRIAQCAGRGIFSMAYGAVYAASEDYALAHPAWVLRDFAGKPHALIGKFFIMDVSEGGGWRANILRQYRYAVESVGFDGIHMDTYGYPKKAFVRDGDSVGFVRLDESFGSLIDDTRSTLDAVLTGGRRAQLIFNNVGNWPVDRTGPAAQDAVYVEVWEPYVRYAHLRDIARSAEKFDKPVILAAYLAPFRTDPEPGAAAAAAKLYMAFCAAHGVSYILFGERGGVLTQGYYGDHSLPGPAILAELKPWIDFPVAYARYFFGYGYTDITETHTAGENREFAFYGAPLSIDGAPGTLWAVIRERPGTVVISLVNLLGQSDDLWNRGKRGDFPEASLGIDIPLYGKPARCFAANPEAELGAARQLDFSVAEGERGPVARLNVRVRCALTLVVFEYVSPD